jgi:hypothetical protein
MAADIKGTAVVWSVGTVTCAGLGTFMTQSTSFERSASKVDIKSTNGTVQTQVFSGFMRRFSMNIIPSASSITNALAASETCIPKPGTSLTIVDDLSTIIDAKPGGANDLYNVISVRQSRTVEGALSVDVELEASDESVQLGVSAA